MSTTPPPSNTRLVLVYITSLLCSITASELTVFMVRTDWGYVDAALLPVVISLYSWTFGCLIWMFVKKMN